jgi:CYTH domain-containing protein
MEIELERTFLLKYIPANLKKSKSAELIDIYLPKSSKHPHLRIRKRGDKFEITKKVPIKEQNSSEQYEFTIALDSEEFKSLDKVRGKKIRKIRYFYPIDGRLCEIDVFQDDLKGLIVADFEFEDVEQKNSFTPPDFCLADVTQDLTIAGGYLAGKKISDIQKELIKYGYNPLHIDDA